MELNYPSHWLGLTKTGEIWNDETRCQKTKKEENSQSVELLRHSNSYPEGLLWSLPLSPSKGEKRALKRSTTV